MERHEAGIGNSGLGTGQSQNPNPQTQVPRPQSFGDRLKHIRGEKPLEQMAVDIGLPAITLFGYEEGFKEIPEEAEVYLFTSYCFRYGIDVFWLLTGEAETEAA